MATNPTPRRPAAVDTFVGRVLELVIYSIEGIRERLGKLTLRSTD